MTNTSKAACGAFRRDSLFGTIHYCELAHGHSQSHQGSSGGWSGIWPRVKGDDASIAISRVERDAYRQLEAAAREHIDAEAVPLGPNPDHARLTRIQLAHRNVMFALAALDAIRHPDDGKRGAARL